MLVVGRWGMGDVGRSLVTVGVGPSGTNCWDDLCVVMVFGVVGGCLWWLGWV